MTKGKITGQYVNGVLAKREAIAMGYDEALLLDPEGYSPKAAARISSWSKTASSRPRRSPRS